MDPIRKKRNKHTVLLIVGLGNPGERYSRTRHNVGFDVIDLLAETLHINVKRQMFRSYMIGKGVFQDTGVYLVKPLTFMNNSGRIFTHLLRKTSSTVQNTIVICDNMDLAPGMIRIRKKGSDAGQNGLKSIIRETGSSGFTRIYVGIGRPAAGSNAVEHVLGIPVDAELEEIRSGLSKAAAAAEQIVSGISIEQVMNEFNRKNS